MQAFVRLSRRTTAAAVLAATLVGATPDSAVRAADRPSETLVDSALIEDLRRALQVPVTTISVIAQNRRTAGLTEAEIAELDRTWRRQREADVQPLVAELFGSPLSTYLLYLQAGSAGLFTEIIIMDARGLNVGQSTVTSDYWQGDEEKFTRTVPIGASAAFVNQAEYEEASATWRCQANFALVDPVDGSVIGAATVEINLTELARRRALSS